MVTTPTRDKGRTAQKLRQLIEAKGVPLGTTPEGRDWCLKALHPSDPLNEVSGIPDESCIPSVFVGYNTQFALSAPPGSTGSWGFDATVLPHPVTFLNVNSFDDSAAHVETMCFNNTQLAGTYHGDKMTSLRSQAERWRLAYMSVTLIQDASALENQGTIVACQTPLKPLMMPYLATPHNALASSAAVPSLTTGVQVWTEGDLCSYTKTQSMPNSYSGPAKEGCYMPLKLTRTHQQWRSAADLVYNLYAPAVTDNGVLTAPTSAGTDWPFNSTTTGLPRPYYQSTTQEWSLSSARVTSALCNDVAGRISGLNLSVNARYHVFVRAGYELQVQPGTTLTPFQRISPRSDEMAVATYFAIAREMKDAYPEEYNSFGKLWDIISSIAKTVAPALSAVPVVGPVLPSAVMAAAGIGDRLRKALSKKPDDVSMADKELIKKAVDSVVNNKPARQPQSKQSRGAAQRRRKPKQGSRK
jgi:hypothetical protein